MSDFIVRLRLEDALSAHRFNRVLGDFLGDLEKSRDCMDFIGVKTELKDGAAIKCVTFETHDQGRRFLSFWKSRLQPGGAASA